MKIIRTIVSTTAAASLLVGGAVAGSARVDEDTSGRVANAEGKVKELGADRQRTERMTPQDIVHEDGVTRIFGTNRYATAAAISEAYGWSFENTAAVYIASGQQFPDALALGPSTLGDGPLLLVKKDGIPSETRRVLTELEPCFIDLVGGAEVINDRVFRELKSFAHPEYCGD